MENAIIDYGPTSSRNFEEAQPLPLVMAPGNIQTRVEMRTPEPTAQTSGFTPQDIIETYEVLAPMATDYANANLERAGQAQASYGPLAQAAMGGSRTAGIGNYTYNRLVRPAVDTMRDQLIVEGYSAALNKQLSDSLNAAKRNYNRAARRRSNGGGGNKNSTDKVTIDDEYTDGDQDNSGTEVGSKEFAGSGKPVTEGDEGTASNLSEEQLEKIREWARLYPNINYPGMYGGF